MQSIYVGVAVALGVLLKSKPDNEHTLYHHLTHRVSVLSPAGSLKESETWRDGSSLPFLWFAFFPPPSSDEQTEGYSWQRNACAKVTANSPWRKHWKCSCLFCLPHLSSCTALSDLLRKRVSLPELHTDPDLILPDTGAALFCTRYLPWALRLLVLHLTLFLAFGEQETQALSQIKWDIREGKWLKEEQKDNRL